MHISNLRAKGTKIESSGATAAGILPFAKLTEANANYWNQGGKRKGSYALYLEPWHSDVFDFLELKSNQGLEANRCRDLFYAMWIPDLFMEEVEKDGLWYLFCPKECPGLSDVYGADFKQLYLRYVEEGKHRKVVKARDLWDAILHSQIEVGMPYIGYKDTVNAYSMQKNIGTIKSSNLCVKGDSLLLTDKGEIPIWELKDKEVTIWNGEEWSKVTVKYTGVSDTSHTVRVRTKGQLGVETLYCTDYHKFPIKTIENQYEHTFIPAHKLQEGMKILAWTLDGKEVQQEIVESCPNYFSYDTYCLTEPKRNMMVVNGILTGQCHEIVEYSDSDETAVCNLANINLDKWYDLRDSEKNKLVETVVRMLNVAIDLSYYPDAKTRKSNLSRRPLGIGVQGLAEYFLRCNVAFDSETAKVNNKAIFQHLYQSALFASNKLVEEGRYGTYLGWLGSPYSEGLDHSDLYGDGKNRTTIPVANSLLIALMPTVTTSQLLGNTESFEPITSNIYKRRGTVGEYTVVNRYLVKVLEEHDLWNDDIRNKIIRDRGSVQHIEEIPDSIKELFKTVWEIKPKVLLDLAIGRQPYVDQAQSMNLFLNTPTKKELTAMHFYSWKGKLKTGQYYLRSGTALNSKKV
jgi:ribonucleotide reductase alpha subunit